MPCPPDRRQPDRRQPDRRQPDRRQPDRRQPDRRQPDRRQPDRRQPDRRQSDRQLARQLARMALCLIERLRPPHAGLLIDLPEGAWQECRRLTRMHELARSRGWGLAAERLRQRLKRQLQELIAALTRALDASAPPTSPVTPRDLYAELLSLHDEFGEV